VFFEPQEPTEQTRTAGEVIRQYAASNAWLEDQLSLYTYGEFQSFVSGIGEFGDIGTRVKALGKNKFQKLVKDNSQSVGLKMDDVDKLKAVNGLSKLTRLNQFDVAEFSEQSIKEQVDVKIDVKIPAIKYLLDRKQSRRQYTKSAAKA
jgi:hypothetical protein